MRNRFGFKTTLAATVAIGVFASIAQAQSQLPDGCTQWKTYTDTIWLQQEVTENRLVQETSYESKEVTKSRPRWISKQKERIVTTRKPVTQTSEKVVSRTVRKPVTTTKTRIEKRIEESWEDVTEMRDETYVVKKPVVETVYEQQQVRVRKPVTRRKVEREEVTVLRPRETTQTTLVPGTLVLPGTQPYSARPRPRWLQRGYYADPVTGQQVWRRTGLHWVNEPRYGQTTVPVVVPQEQTSTTLVPETLVRETPVEETTYIDEYETRKVPVEVERLVTETRTRKVPVTVRVPKRATVEYEVPYSETTYVDETITERIPVEETVMQTVTRREPYTELEATWNDYTETVRVPKTTTKRVPYVSTYRVPYLVEVRVPCDAVGRPIGRGQEVDGTHRLHPNWRSMMTKVDGVTESVSSRRETGSRRSILENATFDIPDARSVRSRDADTSPSIGESVLDTSESLGDPPQDLDFSNGSTRTETSLLRPIPKAKSTPTESGGPVETEESKRNRREIEERFRRLGLSVDSSDITDPPQEEVPTRETSSPTSSNVDEEPARVNFSGEPISIDVDLPPNAESVAETDADAENSDDDTIERKDVDLSRPGR